MWAGRSLSSDHGSASPSTPSVNGPAGTRTASCPTGRPGRQRRSGAENGLPLAQLVGGQHRLDVLLLVLLDHDVGEQLTGTALAGAFERVEDPAADVGDEAASLRRGEQRQVDPGGARVLEGVVQLLDACREQPLRRRVASAEQPEVLLLADVREVPHQRTHQGAVLPGQLALVEVGQPQGARPGGLQPAGRGLGQLLRHLLPPPARRAARSPRSGGAAPGSGWNPRRAARRTPRPPASVPGGSGAGPPRHIP